MPKRVLPLCLMISLLCFARSLSADHVGFAGMLLSDVAQTNAGGPIAVRLATPFAKASDERSLREFLEQPHTLDWDTTTPLVAIARDLSQHVDIQIDIRALDEIGIELTDLKRNSRSETASSSPTDPFSPANRKKRDKDHAVSIAKPNSTPTRWWQSTSKRTNVQGTTTNAAKLFLVLDNLDLTLAHRSGQWFITSIESADEHLDTRLYDITPIKLDESNKSVHAALGGGMFFDWHGIQRGDQGVIHQIETHIRPDTWEMMGGPSTMTNVIIGGRKWIAVSAPIRVQWEIEAFLSQLNNAM